MFASFVLPQSIECVTAFCIMAKTLLMLQTTPFQPNFALRDIDDSCDAGCFVVFEVRIRGLDPMKSFGLESGMVCKRDVFIRTLNGNFLVIAQMAMSNEKETSVRNRTRGAE
jgi:hypothetical protein